MREARTGDFDLLEPLVRELAARADDAQQLQLWDWIVFREQREDLCGLLMVSARQRRRTCLPDLMSDGQ